MTRGIIRSAVPRAVRTTLVFVVVALIVQYYFRPFQGSSSGPATAQQQTEDEYLQQESATTTTTDSSDKTAWELLRSDARVSKFADVISMFDDIVMGLSAPKAKFTLFAPVNDVFDRNPLEEGQPWFYYKFIAGYHMGAGGIPKAALAKTATAASFVNADIFFWHWQRISIQGDDIDADAAKSSPITFNHRVGYLDSLPAAVNGHIHLIDDFLELPDSTASVFRERPSLSTLRQGLVQTGLSDMVNDTNKHFGQTIFAPTNTAFEALGPKVNRFLFSPWGRPYLRALLRNHIVANRTVFSDVYFPQNGSATVPLPPAQAFSRREGDDKDVAWLQLATLNRGVNVTIYPLLDQGRRVQLAMTVNPTDGATAAVKVSVPDIVVMDGAVHEIDSLLLPPRQAAAASATDRDDQTSLPRWLSALVSYVTNKKKYEITIEDLVDRLGPLI